MRNLTCIFILLLSYNLQAQYPFKGEITLQNSGKKAVSGATIEQKPIGNATLSDQEGLFSLQLAGKTSGSDVILDIQKEGYEIVNKDDLYLTLTDDQRLTKYYMCPEGEWEKNAIAYLGISKEHLTRRYIEETKRVKQALAGNQVLMNDSLATLNQRYQNVLTHAQELAERFAIANLDDETDVYNEAFVLFKEGQIQEAIQALTDEKLQAQYDKIKAEVEKGNELVAIGTEKLANAEEAISRGIENYLLKADLLIINFQFEEAGINYRKAVDADTTRAEVRLRYAGFLLNQKFISKAIEQYHKCITHAIDARVLGEAYSFLGLSYAEQNDYENALFNYEEALKINQNLLSTYPFKYTFEMAVIHNNRGLTYFHTNKFNEALVEYDKVLTLFEGAKSQPLFSWLYPKADGIKALAFMNKSLVYTRLNRYEEALNSNQEALELFKKLNEKDTLAVRELLAQVYNNRGFLQIELNSFPEAIDALGKAQKLLNRLIKENPRRFNPILGTVYHNIGNIHRQLYQQSQAFNAYEKGLSIYRALYRENTEAASEGLSQLLNSWAVLHTDLFLFDKALAAHEEQLAILEKMALKSPEKFLPLISIAQANIGRIYTEMFRSTEAIVMFEKAEATLRSLTEQYPDRYEPEFGKILNDLGMAYEEIFQYDLALQKLKEGEKISQKLAKRTPGKFLSNLVHTKINLGKVYKHLGELQKANANFDEAYSLSQKLLANNRVRFAPITAGNLRAIAYSKQELKKYVEAEKMYKESLEIIIPLANQNPQRFQADLGETYFTYASLYYDKGNYDYANSIYQKSLDIYTQLNTKNSNTHLASIAHIQLKMGEAYLSLYQYEVALAAFQKAVKIYETLSIQNPNGFKPDLGVALNNLGVIYGDLGRPDRAIEPLNKAIGYFSSLVKERSFDISYKVRLAGAYNILGVRYKEMNRHSEALGALKYAIQLRQELSNTDPALYELDLAESLNNIGAIYLNMNPTYFSQARKANQEALAIFRKLVQDNPEKINPMMANTINNQGLLKFKEKKYEEALVDLEEAINIRSTLAQKDVQKYGFDLVASLLGAAMVNSNLGNREEIGSLKHQADSVLNLCPDTAKKNHFREMLRVFELYDQTDNTANPIESLKAQVEQATSYKSKILFQTDLIKKLQIYHKDSLDKLSVRREIANAATDLAWFHLFIGETTKTGNFYTAIYDIDPYGIYPRAKKAHYFLIEGFYDWAEEAYRQYKDTPYDGTKMWKEVYLEDLQEMEDAGIISDMRKDFLKKVRKLLNE